MSFLMSVKQLSIVLKNQRIGHKKKGNQLNDYSLSNVHQG